MLKIHASPVSVDLSRRFESTETGAIRILNGLSRTLLILAVISAPWLFGGYETRVQLGLYITVALALMVWIVAATAQAFSGDVQTNRLPTTIVPLIGFFLLGCCQLFPSLQMPPAEEIQKAVENASGTAAEEPDRWSLTRSTLIRSLQTGGSISPAATRFELARLAFVITTFFLGTQLFATSSTQPWLWGAMALNGAVVSFFGICQQLSWNNKMFWTFPLKHGGSPFSAFVNRNNAAGYLCVCLAAGLGWMIYTFSKTHAWPMENERFRFEAPRSTERSLLFSLSSTINELTFWQMLSTTSVFLMATGIILAMSRGGWLGLGCATFAAVVVANPDRRGRSLFLTAGVGLLITLLVAWAGFGDRLRQRWDAIPSADSIYQEGRFGHWADAIRIIPDFPRMGTGLGTYQYAYLPYQTHPELAELRFYNADNQFLEWAVEGGGIGISLVVLGLLSTIGLIFTLCRDRFEPAGTVGVFAIVSQVVTACFDFGPTMPANMLAISVIFGGLTGRAALLINLNHISKRSWGLTFPPLKPLILIPAFGVGLLCFDGIGLREVKAASASHAISRNLPPMNSADDLDEASVDALIHKLTDALKIYPDDPEAHLALADLWIYKFRLKEFQNRGGRDGRDETLWLETHPIFLYRQFNQWHAAEQFELTGMLLENPEIQNCLRPAHDHLLQSLRVCPLMPDIGPLLATLQFITAPEAPAGESYLRRALVLGPSSPSTFFQIGQLAEFAELTSFSHSCWKKSLQLGPRFLRDIHTNLATKLSLEEELNQVIPPSGDLLLELAQSYPVADHEYERTQLAAKAIEILSQDSSGPDVAKNRHLIAKAYAISGLPDDAIQAYRQALDLSPDQIQWRVELVKLLAEFRGLHWALREAETCVALAPDRKPLQDLVQDLRMKIANEQTAAGTANKGH